MLLFYVVVWNGYDFIVDLLIQYGVDCNQSDMDGRSFLYVVLRFGYMIVVEVFINYGVDVN